MIKTNNNNNNITSVTATTKIKLEMDRRPSTPSSESSVEPMDLGRTPTPKKKLLQIKDNNDNDESIITLNNKSLLNNIDSEENTYDSEEHENEYLQQQQQQQQQQKNNNNNITTNLKLLNNNNNKKLHRQRSNNNNNNNHREKRIVQIEENDNPHSLRKKFRISTPNRNNNNNNNLINHKNNNNLILTKYNNNNINDNDEDHQQKFDNISTSEQQQQIIIKNNDGGGICIGSGDEDRTNNESGFVDTSGHNINSSPASTSSSPESGIGERDDVKYVCPICEVVSATPHEFTNHIRCHNYSSGDSENFTCRICSKVLSSASSLDRHVLVHTGERPFNCKYCHLTFTTNGNMHRHMRTHKQHQQQHHQRNNNNNNNNNSSTVTTNGSDSGGGGGGIQNKTSNNNKIIKDNKTNNNKINIGNTKNNNNNNISGGSGNNSSSNGGESYESDGGCSTDSSVSARSNFIIKTKNNDNNNIINNNNNIIINNYNKRKSTDDDNDDDGENILGNIIKRRLKTNINNNNNNNIINENDIINGNITTNNNDNNNHTTSLISKFCCPVCNRNDFINMLTLGTHMDFEHSDIPAKCRECDVVFKTHKQLNGHRCCITTSATTSITNNNNKLNISHGFRDLTFVDFSSEKFPLIAKSLCEQTLRTSSINNNNNQKFECPKCYKEFSNDNAIDIHIKECYYHDQKTLLLSSSSAATTNNNNNKLIASLPSSTILPHDFSMRKKNIRKRTQSVGSESSIDDDDDDNNNNNNDNVNNTNRNRDDFFAHLDLQNKSASSLMSSPSRTEKSDYKSDLDKTPTTNNEISHHHMNNNNNNNNNNINNYLNHHQNNNQSLSSSFSLLQQQQVLQQQQHDSKDLADIQSILNVTSSSNNFLRNFENNVNTPSSECGYGKDEEEAQDAFTSEFRKMKLRGEFPCKLCTAVFPNLRALKGHNRIHISAAGAAGPFRCNMCPYSIHDKAALVRHMRSHNGDRPYECAVCNYAFTTKANCERHLRNRHAKTTREEVKRAIIYHPSEDSSCDDPTKKLHLFSSPEFDNDDVVEINPPPKDRSTPVSHLKEMLQNDNKPMKIQVKSLEKLIDKSSMSSYGNYDDREDKEMDNDSPSDISHPIDLSMDVLDLSKKSTKVIEEKLSENDNIPEQPKIDMDLLQKNHQILLAQQQFLSENLPKIDSAQYLQFSQLCSNLVFPQFHPAFFLQNTFLPNNLSDFNKFAPLLSAGIFGNAPAFNIPSVLNGNIQNQQMQQQQEPQSPTKIFENPIQKLTSTSPAQQLLPKSLTPSSNQLNISHHLSPPEQSIQSQQKQQQQPQQTQSISQPTQNNNNGPVKMVIKNGVLMPKQKQRRYRTERPFACEHCSARFTLRSNMERHIKQQHPQQWAQRQRTGQHVVRGRGNSSNVMSQISSPHIRNSSMPVNNNNNNNTLSPSNHFSAISDQVKYAILAQQLKARKDTDILQQALSQGSNNVNNSFNNTINSNNNNISTSVEDDDPKLIIDEDEEEDDDEEQEDDDDDDVVFEEPKPQDLSNIKEINGNKTAAKKVAETILEQAIKAGNNLSKKCLNNDDRSSNATKEFELKIANTMIARAESVGKYLKEVASSPFKDDQPDLVSVSKLVDNATIPLSFNNYFRPSDVANQMEQSDEEGLVASGSASDNNSGPEEALNNVNQDQKKKSAYSLAPNRVSCPYCQRMFPWSSSLRRHILTHTGQKPFKCSHCPLLFTTKSNCDRHLLRKHGNVESAVSLYVPIEDIPDPIPKPKAIAEANAAAAAAAMITTTTTTTTNEEIEIPKKNSINLPIVAPINLNIQKSVIDPPIITSADLPYKCHLCDSSFSERVQCLDHIKISHIQEFALLLAKGAIDTETEHNNNNNNNQIQSINEDDERRADDGRGKYPDYANRKVICAFCIRRFWSTEDLRRHMRTHSGERPFQCEICLRKFTLKHSMLRHMKKHNGNHHNNMQISINSGSDISDDEQQQISGVGNGQINNTITGSINNNINNNMIVSNSLRNHKIHDILSKANNIGWRNQMGRYGLISEHQKENIALQQQQQQTIIKTEQNTDDNNIGQINNGITSTPNSDLIGNLLGISDQGILNKLLSSADEAAKFLGIDK